MKSVTEFPVFTLNAGLKTKTALTGEGKTPEEIQTSLGESLKMEGDRLKHFVNALEVAGQNTQNLKRVLVVKLNEGETAPEKALSVEDHHYVPEFLTQAKPAPSAEDAKNARRGKGRGGRSEKSSPWGLSPEQKAEKKNKSVPAKP